jgi:hypothetical protein
LDGAESPVRKGLQKERDLLQRQLNVLLVIEQQHIQKAMAKKAVPKPAAEEPKPAAEEPKPAADQGSQVAEAPIVQGTIEKPADLPTTTKAPSAIQNPKSLPATRDVLDIPIAIITCGLSPLNINRIGSGENRRHIRWNDFDASDIDCKYELYQQLNKAFPDELTLARDNKLFILDSRNLGSDPEKTKSFRGHTGFHPKITSEILHGDAFKHTLDSFFVWLNEVIADPTTDSIAIPVFCIQGRHRSVAAAHVLYWMLVYLGFKTVAIDHHSSKVNRWDRLCGGTPQTLCQDCKGESDEGQACKLDIF